MVEPEIAEKIVPATTATTASRPGTCGDQALHAVDHLHRDAGVKQHLAHQDEERDRREGEAGDRDHAVARELRHARLAAEAQIAAPAMFTAMKVKATGRPSEQQQRRAAEHQPRGELPRHSGRRDGVLPRAALALHQAAHAEQHLDREQREGDRKRREQPPLRRDHASCTVIEPEV